MYGWVSPLGKDSNKIDLRVDFSEPDMRDDRDPQMLGEEILAKSNGKPAIPGTESDRN